jgi:hypothetical protein
MGEILKAEDIRFKVACKFMSGTHDYRIEPKDYAGTTIEAEVGHWKWTPDGDLVRRMYGHYILRSKTREFEQSFFAQAMIPAKEIPKDIRARVQLMEEKTYNMESTFVFVLEMSYGKGQTFPNRRGRFTIREILDHERKQGK